MTSVIKSAELNTQHLSTQAARPDGAGEEPASLVLLDEDSTDGPLTTRVIVEQSQAVAPIDIDQALQAVDGDIGLLRDVVRMFVEEYPAQLEALRLALSTQDAAGVENAARRLQQFLCNVGGTNAQDLAHQLELIGEQGKLDGGVAVLQILETEIERVTVFFSTTEWEQSIQSPLEQGDVSLPAREIRVDSRSV
jgi:HPt (histidine-containing phosphotransfer) domain-containing protein